MLMHGHTLSNKARLSHSWFARLQDVPREPDRIVYAMRSLAALPLRAFLRIYHRLQIVGREHFPPSGSFVMVSNHASHLDALCLLAAMPLARLHQTFTAAAHDYFFMNPRRLAMAAIFANAIPFHRKEHRRGSLQCCRELLAVSGNVLILFPEGTRSCTGALGAFRPGIGALVAGTEVPVVPCAIHGPFRAWPKGACFPRPRQLRLVIGTPRRYADLPPGRMNNERVAADLQSTVQEMLCA